MKKYTRPLRIGVLGCGPIAQAAHLEVCRKARNAELYAICDQAEDLVTRMAAVHEPHVTYLNYDEKKREIELAAVSGTYNMIHPDPRVRAVGLQRLRVLAAACKGMGIPVNTLCTGTRHPTNMWQWHPENASSRAWRDLLHAMEAALQIAAEEGVTLAFEPERANVVNTAAKGRALLDAMQSPRLKVVLDPANLISPADEQEIQRVLAEAFDLLGEHVIIAHAKDRGSDDTFTAAGEGMLDYDDYVRHLRAISFDSPLIVHGLAETQVDAVLQFLRSILQQGCA